MSIISKRGVLPLIDHLAELARNQPLIDGTSSTRCLPSEQLNEKFRWPGSLYLD